MAKFFAMCTVCNNQPLKLKMLTITKTEVAARRVTMARERCLGEEGEAGRNFYVWVIEGNSSETMVDNI